MKDNALIPDALRTIEQLNRLDETLREQIISTFIVEKERWQAQKIEAVERLAGGIAHDFNNFLAVIMLHVDMLNRQLPAESPLRTRTNEIKQVTNNAAAVVRQLLAFSRKQPLKAQPFVLNQTVDEIFRTLKPTLPKEIDFQLDLVDDLGVCFIDTKQIAQVLSNLTANAVDAMPQGGTINIETRNVTLDKKTVRHIAQPSGHYIQLSVSDTGGGIKPELLDRIFEPFFTTKESSKGSGLGLSTVFGIVKQSNGFIWVNSEPGKGSNFEIQFPRIDQEQNENREAADVDSSETGKTILLVEDEEIIRRIIVEILGNLGYQIFEYQTGMQALQFVDLYKKPIDLLITDVNLPQINGRDLAVKVKSSHPETAVLFISGYLNDVISDENLNPGADFLGKPFSDRALIAKVRQMLASGAISSNRSKT